MRIFGISGSLIGKDNHDLAAALYEDGKIVANYEEERLCRIKHSKNLYLPDLCIQKIFQEKDITFDDIDVIAIPHNPETKEDYSKKLKEHFKSEAWCFDKLFYSGHHRAHIYDSLFQSGFDSAACLVIDGVGDIADSTTLAHFRDNCLDIIKVYTTEASLGALYSAGTTVCGFNHFDEGKLMGLSSYGKPVEKMPLKWDSKLQSIESQVFSFESNLNIDMPFEAFIRKNDYPYRARVEQDNIMYYVNVAASIQDCFNRIVLELVKYLKEVTKEDNLILSGGCIQNCITNELIIESGLFKNVFAAPAVHDAGCAAGLALNAAHELGEKIQNIRLKNSYTGSSYSDEEILKVCNDTSYALKQYNEDYLIDLLRKDNMVAWFQGGSELGPRALGHRSLLGNPSNRSNLFKINDTIKYRENWRPLAPSIPIELFKQVMDTDTLDLTEFMLRTIKIRPEWRKKLIAVCHIDNTTRPQSVEKEQNPEFHSLLMNFYKKTGVPGLINTSFNGRGEPIIETPEQAVAFMDRTPNLKAIVFNAKYVLER